MLPLGKQIIFLVLSCSMLSGLRVTTRAASAIQPDLRINASVLDVNGGTLQANDVIEYTFQVENIGDDNATLVVLMDSIPANTSYVSGSLKIDSVAKSDASLDDQAEYSALQNRVTFRLGIGATGLTGGVLLPAGTTIVQFRVRIGALVANGTAISNQASSNYSGTVILGPYTTLSDSNPDVIGNQPSIVFVNIGPPNIQLVHSVTPNGVQQPGSDLAFTSTFINSGNAQAQNFAITEQIPGNTSFKLGSVITNLGTTGLGVVVQYSRDNGGSFIDTPVSGGGGAIAGYDRNVTNIRFVFTGLLGTGTPNNTGSVGFQARIE